MATVMSIKRAPIPLLLFAKPPRAGRVKTRMQPQLSAADAARLAQAMLDDTLANACANWPGEVALCVLPGDGEMAVAQLAARHGITTTAQVGDDLGARMLNALAAGIERAGAAAVLGCDVPHCPAAVLASAHALLVHGDNPIGISADGGFYFLGLHRAPPELFAGVEWGRAAVADSVRDAAAGAGIELTDLPTLRDIDRFEDLRWLAGIAPGYRRFVAAATIAS